CRFNADRRVDKLRIRCFTFRDWSSRWIGIRRTPSIVASLPLSLRIGIILSGVTLLAQVSRILVTQVRTGIVIRLEDLASAFMAVLLPSRPRQVRTRRRRQGLDRVATLPRIAALVGIVPVIFLLRCQVIIAGDALD